VGRSEPSQADEQLIAARAALASHDWRRALELLTAADGERQLAGADLDCLGEATMWAGHVDDCLAAWERAYAAHVEAGDPRAAATAALRLVRESTALGDNVITGGWLRRALRLLEPLPECTAHGYLAQALWFVAMDRKDHDEAERQAQRMIEIGSSSGDLDLQALGLSRHGHTLVARGATDEGVGLLDEATTAAVSGELTPYATFVVYCETVSVCRDLTDYRRAGQWTDAAKRWCERRSVSGFPGICRVYHAEILRLRGDLSGAERDVLEACDELTGAGWGTLAGAGFCELGEIRLRVGDLDGADEAFRTAYQLGRDPQPGLALVRLAQGRPADAASALARALEQQADDRLMRARLLPAQVEVALASGDGALAQAAAAELSEIADEYDTDALQAGAAYSRAAVALGTGEGEAALTGAEEARRRWQLIDLPYESARARLLVAEALRRRGDHDAAGLELSTAQSTFAKLGARRDAALVAQLLAKSATAGAGAEVTRAFMFTDVVSSTDLIGVIGDEPWAAARGWHDRVLRGLFSGHDGEEITHAGDGFFVAFPSPAAALACAVEIQRALEAHRREHGFALPVRIGVHAACAQQTPDGYAGRGVHAAARISAVAGAGEILASTETLTDCAGEYTVGPARDVTLKGLPDPVEIAEVRWH
jgi:class 3 adenylate cyclase/tetratricopeptide (TPR) repeat protein